MILVQLDLLLHRTKHLPIKFHTHHYFMADNCRKFEVIRTVKIFTELSHIQTNIVVGVVNSLYTDCILGMDYINKYKVNLNNKQKQIEVHTYADQITLPMEAQMEKIRIVCRSAYFMYLNPYQEKQIKIISQVSSKQMLFSPDFRVTHKQGLIIPHSLISITNHVAWISVYNLTAYRCYLNKNIIVGIASPLSPNISTSTIFGLHSKETIDKDQTKSLTSINEQHINRLLAHIQHDQQLNDLWIVLKKHHLLFDTSTTTITQTSTPHVICTGDHPPTTSKPYP